MKKQQVFRRIGSLWRTVRDFFVEEEPRDRARRTMREATQSLNRVIYQRMVLESELRDGGLDEQTRHWCEKNLQLLQDSEREMTARLGTLREEYRTLMLQDLFYATINNPGGESFEEAQQAILELQAAVEAERAMRSLPRLVAPLQVAAEDEAATDEETTMPEPASENHRPLGTQAAS